MRIIGYGICAGGEADRYLKGTLDCFKKLCDDTIILGNNLTDKEKSLIGEYGFTIIEDNREWGKNQNLIKQDFLKNYVAKLNPDFTVCLDMDEILEVSRETLEEYTQKGQAWYVYIVNLWNDGYRSDWSFWNVRFWGWQWKEKLGDTFFEFENRPLHCGLAPKWAYYLHLHAPFMLLHYGLKDKTDRMKKVARYEKYDPKQIYRHPSYYRALKLNEAEPFDKKKIQIKLNEHIDSLNQPLNKELPIKKSAKEQIMVQREADGFIFTIDKQLLPTQLKQKYKGKGFKAIK